MEIALSTTEAEYTGLSYALREVIPLMELLKEMKEKEFDVLDHKVKAHCIVFEDNYGAIEMAVVHKCRPRTKHLATKLHHFRSYVNSGNISVHKIDSNCVKITTTNGNCPQYYRSGVYRTILRSKKSHLSYGASERN